MLVVFRGSAVLKGLYIFMQFYFFLTNSENVIALLIHCVLNMCLIQIQGDYIRWSFYCYSLRRRNVVMKRKFRVARDRDVPSPPPPSTDFTTINSFPN